ncbi:MAG: acyl-CoA dehydrogenase family protein [Acidimicrobiia bacterium]|nr:acyl-CoA dehydrogenase family protein [Acidimicrobiia bacterium]
MDFALSPAEEQFRDEVRTWLEEHLVGDFADLRGRGGMGQEDIPEALLIAWEQELAAGGWVGLGYPEALGGRPVTLMEQVVFFSTYVEARAPGRIPNVGSTLLGPTVVAYGTDEQKQRWVPPIIAASEWWCQGYSEPNAGSDLANVSTKAVRDGDRWVISGQKVWTSLAHMADWCFVVARTDPSQERHKGLSYLLVPMDQPGIEVRPIVQITGGTEFNEVFFDEARTPIDNIVGTEGDGWKVAMGTLGFERGASTLGQQMTFRQEFDQLLEYAQQSGAADDPVLRQELAQAYSTLEILRYNQLRMLSIEASGGVPGPEMSIGKLYWASWHRAFGELMMRVRGATALVAGDPATGEGYVLDSAQRTFLYSRAHTIYGGSNQVQRNILGERVLGLPREPR